MSEEEEIDRVSMLHWNGNQCVSIDTETTGRELGYHEVVQVAMVPLDHNFDPRKDVSPFVIYLKPEFPERASPEAMRVNGLDLEDLKINGIDREVALGMFERWFDTLGLPYTKWGTRKRIIPLGQNYAFDERGLRAWMGHDYYESKFSYEVRDTKASAQYLNDNAAMHGEPLVFNKMKLGDLAKKFKIPNDNAHDAYFDAVMAAKVYKKMCLRGIIV